MQEHAPGDNREGGMPTASVDDLLAEYLGVRAQQDEDALAAFIAAFELPLNMQHLFRFTIRPDETGALFDACRAALSDAEIRALHRATVQDPTVRRALNTVRRVHLEQETQRVPGLLAALATHSQRG